MELKQNQQSVAAGALYNIPSSRGGAQQQQQLNSSQLQIRYIKHNLDLNSPRTQQAFLNLGLTLEDIQQKNRQQVVDKSLSEEANDFKFRQYVMRVNDAVRHIQHERKDIVKKSSSNYNLMRNSLTIDQVLSGGSSSMMRPLTAANNSNGFNSQQYFPQTTKNQQQPNNRTLQINNNIGSGNSKILNQLQYSSTIRNQKVLVNSGGNNNNNQNLQSLNNNNNNQSTMLDSNQYQLQLIKSQGYLQIQQQQNELKQFLFREKEKSRQLKNMEKRFAKLEEKQKEKAKIIKEMAQLKEEKRQLKSQMHKQKEIDKQKSVEKLQQQQFLNNSKYGGSNKGVMINKSIDQQQRNSTTMMSNFSKTASQIMIQQRIEQSKQKRIQMDEEVESKIERDKQHYIEKQLRSAINHELVIEDMVSNLREKTQTVQLKHEYIRLRDNHSDLMHEFKYLNKTEAIQKKREEQEKRYQEKAKRLQNLHMMKRERFESHKKEQQQRIKELEKEQMTIERKQYQTMTSLMKGGLTGGDSQSQSILKISESMSRLGLSRGGGDRNHLLQSANSSRGFSRAQKEKQLLKREIVEENLDRERRKREWKKLNILAKEQLYDEKIKAQRDQQRQLLHSQNNMRIRKNVERDRIISTINLVKAAPFSPTAKRLIERTLPQSAGQDLMLIYRDSSEERRKKKDEEKNNF